jgi:hypothetical protein
MVFTVWASESESPHDELAEGRQEGEAAVTLRLLTRRCGPLSEATTAQIQALPLEQLEGLADALLDVQGPADLAAWLAANPSYTLTISTELLEAAATQPSRFNHNGVGVSHCR